MPEHRIPHDFEVTAILEPTGAHDGVIEIYVWNHARRQLALHLKDLRFDAVSISRGLHVLRDARLHPSLLNVERVTDVIRHAEDVIQVSMLRRHDRLDGCAIPPHLWCLLKRILHNIIWTHLKILGKT